MKKFWLLILPILISLLGFLPVQVFSNSNLTNLIQIEVKKNSSTEIELKYTILQTFNESSRGIFISLPKNQDGIWTNYTLKSVKRSIAPNANLPTDKVETGFDLNLQDEPYDLIKEWDQLRVRVGKPYRYLENGLYAYEIVVLASTQADWKYDFTALYDWQDPVRKIRVFNETNTDLCEVWYDCKPQNTKIAFNPEKPEVASFLKYTIWLVPFFIIFLVMLAIFTWLWHNFTRDPVSRFSLKHPSYEPPKAILPWQAGSLLNFGQIDFKNTLLSYFLYLNHKKYIKIETVTDPEKKNKNPEVKISILQKLPEGLLPEIYNTAVLSSAEFGLKEGILSSKINPNDHLSQTVDFISHDLKVYYSRRPLANWIAWSLGLGVALFFIPFWVLSLLRDWLLVGNSYQGLTFFSMACIFVGMSFLLYTWSKFTLEGADLRAKVGQYKHYLEKVEKLKLDFSNNPKDGVQYYLQAVPFASAFGILPKFQKYFQQIIPDTSEISQTNLFYNSFNNVTFFTSPNEGLELLGGIADGFSSGGGSW